MYPACRWRQDYANEKGMVYWSFKVSFTAGYLIACFFSLPFFSFFLSFLLVAIELLNLISGVVLVRWLKLDGRVRYLIYKDNTTRTLIGIPVCFEIVVKHLGIERGPKNHGSHVYHFGQ